jgi:hypothetical protein
MTFAAGEAKYVDDIGKCPDELYAAFVLATVANCDLGLYSNNFILLLTYKWAK